MSFSFRAAIIILATCSMLQPLGMDIFVSGLSSMRHSLNLSEKQVQYLLVSFMLATGLTQLLAGLVAERVGRKLLMVLALVLYSISSYLCTSTTNLILLTLFRFVQGMSAASALTASFTIIRDCFDGNQVAKAFSYIGGVLATVAMLAPLLGTYLMSILGTWQVTFYFLSVFSFILIFLCLIYLPETKPKQSTSLSLTQLLLRAPAILSHKDFINYTASATTAMTGLFLYFSIGSLVLMERYHITREVYAILFGLNALIYLITNLLSSNLIDKLSSRVLMVIGNGLTLVGAITMLVCSFLYPHSTSAIILSNCIITGGSGLMIGPATAKALNPFKEAAGTASGLFGTIQYGGAALIGFLTTRFPLNSMLPLAIPMLLLALINLFRLGLLPFIKPRRLSVY